MKYILLLLCCLFLRQNIYSQNPVNSVEIGMSGDYFINKVKYKLKNMQHIRLPYFSYTRALKKYYIKADYTWINYEYSFDVPYIFTDDKEGFLISKFVDIFNVGIAYKELLGLKNTILFLNLSYIDYVSIRPFSGIGSVKKEVFAPAGALRSLGIGGEVKQRINIIKNIYAHINVAYTYYFSKDKTIFNKEAYKYQPIKQTYFSSSFGLGYRF